MQTAVRALIKSLYAKKGRWWYDMLPFVLDTEVPATAKILTKCEDIVKPQKFFQIFLLFAFTGVLALNVQAMDAEETAERVAAGNFIKQLQTLVEEGKRQELAKLVNYPLTVDGKNRAKNADAFVTSYDAVFTKAVQTCLREHKQKEEIFSRNGQYMVGWGCIWFSPAERRGMTIDAVNTKP